MKAKSKVKLRGRPLLSAAAGMAAAGFSLVGCGCNGVCGTIAFHDDSGPQDSGSPDGGCAGGCGVFTFDGGTMPQDGGSDGGSDGGH